MVFDYDDDPFFDGDAESPRFYRRRKRRRRSFRRSSTRLRASFRLLASGVRKEALAFSPNDVTISRAYYPPLHSRRRASTGASRAAFNAGYQPKKTPTPSATE